jgi:hypothetical protein
MRLPDRPTADDPADGTMVPAGNCVAAELAARLLRLPAGHPSAPHGDDGRIAIDREWPAGRGGRVDAQRGVPDTDADWVGGRRVWPGGGPDWLGAGRPRPDYAADYAPGGYDDGISAGPEDQGPAEIPESATGVSPADQGESGAQPGQDDANDDAGADDVPADPGHRAGGPTLPGWVPAPAAGASADQGPYRPWFAASGSPEPWFATGPGDVLAGPG